MCLSFSVATVDSLFYVTCQFSNNCYYYLQCNCIKEEETEEG